MKMRLIDADAFRSILEMQKFYGYGDLCVVAERGRDAAIAWLDLQPTVDVTPVRHGKWEHSLLYVKCSVCHYVLANEAFCGGVFNYCPSCGAKMDFRLNKPTGAKP